MSSNIDALIREGVAALRAGLKEDAFNLLTRATELDERNEDAWLWLSAVVDSPEDQQICLENVLAINPENIRAQKGLETIQKKLEGQGRASYAAPLPQQGTGGAPADYEQEERAVQSGDEYEAMLLSNEEAAGRNDDLSPDGDEAQELFGQAYAPVDEAAVDPGRSARRAGVSFDPYAVPQANPWADDDLTEADELDEDDGYFFDDLGIDEVAPDGAGGAADEEAGYRDEQRLIGLLDDIPSDIKPTRLPGKGSAYPAGLLVSLGVLGVGIVLALVVLVLLIM
jgi:hypothetical protein